MRDYGFPASAPNPIRHSYLLDEAVWLVSGVYINEKSVSVDVEGESVITHRDGRWCNDLTMELKTEDGAEYRNLKYKTLYEYAIIESLHEPSPWQASNAVLGHLHGLLVFVDDTILSSFRNSNGSIRGIESLRQISEYQYQCRGALFESGK
ncbi:MAG: hypothetical protein ACU843_11610, partial [Gammaproteobacteria bacterium]